MYMYIEILLCN